MPNRAEDHSRSARDHRNSHPTAIILPGDRQVDHGDGVKTSVLPEVLLDRENRSGSGKHADFARGTLLQRSVFFWVTSKRCSRMGPTLPPAQHETITADEVASTYGVPRYLVVAYLEREINKAAACKSLPFTLLLVVSYACMAIAHMDAPTVRAVENSVSFDIEDNANFAFDSPFMGHKDIQDVNSHTDFWSFMNMGIIPLFYIHERQWNEDLVWRNNTEFIVPTVVLPKKEWSFIVLYNRIVGGVLLRQERAKLKECDWGRDINKWYGRRCLDTGRFYDQDPELAKARNTVDATRVVWLWVHKTQAELFDRISRLESEGWLDAQTQKVELAIPIYNAEYNVHSLVTVNFFFSRGGHIWKHIITQSCHGQWYPRWYNYAFDLSFFGCIAWMLFTEMLEMGMTLHRSGLKGLWVDYIGIWNASDWLSILTAVVLMSMFIVVWQLTDELNSLAIKYGELEKPIKQNITDVPEVRDYTDKLIETVNVVTYLQRGLALYPLLVVFRLFKAFHAQPRLALVTMTMQGSAMDLLHFLFVCILVFIGFVTSGVVLFGREVAELSSMWRGTIYCFRLLLGDIDFDGLKQAGRVRAGIWLMSFMIGYTLLLLNMLLAIVMDSYSNVKQGSSSTQTLLEELREQIERQRDLSQGNHVPVEVVLKALEEFDYEVAALKTVDKNEDAPSSREGEEDDSRSYGSPMQMAMVDRKCLRHADMVTFVDRLPEYKAFFGLRGKARWSMTTRQAHEILIGAIHDFYLENQRSADALEYIRVAGKINATVHSMHGALDNDSETRRVDSPRTLSDIELEDLNVNEVIYGLRNELSAFLEDVQADRQEAAKELSRLNAEVAALRAHMEAGAPADAALVAELLRDHEPGGSRGLASGDGCERARGSGGVGVSSLSAAGLAGAGTGLVLPPRSRERGGSRLARLDEEPNAAGGAHTDAASAAGGTAPAATSRAERGERVSPNQIPAYISLLQREGLLPPDYLPSENSVSQGTPEWPDEVSLPSNSNVGSHRPPGSGARVGTAASLSGLSGASLSSGPSGLLQPETVLSGISDIDLSGSDIDELGSPRMQQSPLNSSRRPLHSGTQPPHGTSGAPGGVGGSLPSAGAPASIEFTTFRDAQSQIRELLSRHRDRPAGHPARLGPPPDDEFIAQI